MPIVAVGLARARRAGAFIGAVGVAQDLTETRLAQAALAEVEAALPGREALAHVGRWLWDVGTDAVQWSDELHRIHGVDPLDFDGTLDAHLAWSHPDDRDAGPIADGGRRSASGQPFEDEYRHRPATATTRAGSYDACRAHDRLVGRRRRVCAASSQDITRQRRPTMRP